MNIKFFLITAVLLLSFDTKAQFAQMHAGASLGINPALLGCGYPQSIAAGTSVDDDEVRDLRSRNAEIDEELRDLRREERQLRSESSRALRAVKANLRPEFALFVETHGKTPANCSIYAAGASVPGNWTPQLVADYCEDGGRIKAGGRLCGTYPRPGRPNISACTEGVQDYREKLSEAEAKKEAIAALTAEKRENSRLISTLSREITNERRREARERTEGGVCVGCDQATIGSSRGTNWGGVAANMLTGLAGVAVGTYADRTNAAIYADAGQRAYPTASWTFGLPYLANGLAGMLGGGTGQGGFGCGPNGGAASMYGNPMANLYGNPYAQYMPGGGGAYMPGVGGFQGIPGMGGAYPGYGGQAGFGGLAGMDPTTAAMLARMGFGGAGGQFGAGGFPFGGAGGQFGLGGAGGQFGFGGPGGQFGAGGMNPAIYQMQMQMQQQQMQMQMQVQMQQQMQRQQALAGLNQELSSLVYRINAIQSGASIGVGVGGAGAYVGVGGNYGGVPFGGVGGVGGVPSTGSYISGGALGGRAGAGAYGSGYLGTQPYYQQPYQQSYPGATVPQPYFGGQR